MGVIDVWKVQILIGLYVQEKYSLVPNNVNASRVSKLFIALWQLLERVDIFILNQFLVNSCSNAELVRGYKHFSTEVLQNYLI